MISTLSLFGALALSLVEVRPVLAANDWTTPCISGSCTYESGDGISTAYNVLALNGSSSTLSDITPAAGWSISGCVANSTAPQTIQLTCDTTGANAANCAHVMTGNPVNKVIRLTDACGSGPFARIAAWSNSTSARRDGTIVQSCSFDYNFTQIPSTQAPLSFSVYGSSVQGALNNVTSAVTSSIEAQKRAYPRRALAPRSFVSDIISAISKATTVDDSISVKDNLNFVPGKTITLIDQSVSCGKVKESLTITVDPKLTGQIDISFAIQGQIVPPKLNDIALNAKLSADASAVFDVKANLDGTISESLTIFSIGIPGLDIPGIFNLGPTFSIDAKFNADLSTTLDATITIEENLKTVDFLFPPSAGKSSVSDSRKSNSSPVKLSIAATGDIAGDLKADLIPKIDFGVDILGGFIKADVFLQADIGADLKASVSATKSSSNTKSSKNSGTLTGHHGSNSTISNSTSTISHYSHNNTSSHNSTSTGHYNSTSLVSGKNSNSTSTYLGHGNSTSTAAKSVSSSKSKNTGSDVSISGSVELDLTIDITAGANADLGGLFDDSKTIDIFDKTFTLFKKSFGNSSRRRWAASGARKAKATRRSTAKRSLTCPSSVNIGDALSLVV